MEGLPPSGALLEVESDGSDDPQRSRILDPVDLVGDEDHLVGFGDEHHDRVVRRSSLVGDERGDVEGERRRREVEREGLEWTLKTIDANSGSQELFRTFDGQLLCKQCHLITQMVTSKLELATTAYLNLAIVKIILIPFIEFYRSFKYYEGQEL